MQLNPASSFLYYVHLGRADYLEGRYKRVMTSIRGDPFPSSTAISS